MQVKMGKVGEKRGSALPPNVKYFCLANVRSIMTHHKKIVSR